MKKSVQLVKENQKNDSQAEPKVVITGNQTSYSKVIQSWVVEFRKRDGPEPPVPFAKLFKAEPPQISIQHEADATCGLAEKKHELIDRSEG